MAERITRCRPLLGTFVEVTCDSARAADAAFDAVARVHALMSAHDPDSELSRINRLAHERPIAVHPWTAAVLERALLWAKASKGAFDPARAGANAVERNVLPRHPGMQRTYQAHWDDVVLGDHHVRLRRPACIDLGGIAKGFAVDRAIAAMRASGAAYGLVNAGGDLAGFGPEPWDVEIVEPQSRLAMLSVPIRNEALATSALQPSSSGGLSADHLFSADPRWTSTTVVAPSAMDADALAKIVLSGSPETAHCLALARAKALVIDSTGAVREVDRSTALAEAA
jgi:thiamine biosynthesis lipoprotein